MSYDAGKTATHVMCMRLSADPNLTYAKNLVQTMGLGEHPLHSLDGLRLSLVARGGCVCGRTKHTMWHLLCTGETKPAQVPEFGAACDGDADRNMILGANEWQCVALLTYQNLWMTA